MKSKQLKYEDCKIIAGGITSTVYKVKEAGIVIKQLEIPCPNLIEQEVSILNLLSEMSSHFPKVHNHSIDDLWIEMDDCGISIDKVDSNVITENCLFQCKEIAETLNNCGIYHNDIRASNILYKNDSIYLIDFTDIKQYRQGIRPLKKFFEFEEGIFYECKYIHSDNIETIFITIDDKRYTTLNSYIDIIKTKSWPSQEKEIEDLVREYC